MNKTFLIAGGTAVVSLAVGTAGGYFIAKKRFEDGLPEIINNETEAMRKHFSVLLMEARNGKPSSPADIPRREDEDPEGADALPDPDELSDEEETEEFSDEDKVVYGNAQRALTDYQKISTQIVRDQPRKPEVVTNNVFDTAKSVRPLPPRGPGGKFRPKTVREENSEPPELIDAEVFLSNDSGNDQESLLYFINDKTLVLTADPNEGYDVNKVGEVNLTLFPNVPEGEASMIYVSNMGLGIDYEIKRMDESLTDHLGMGENGEDLDHDTSAWV